MMYTEHNMFIYFIAALVIGLVTSYFAEKKGRSQLGWFILGALFGILALIVLYFMPDVENSGPTMSVSEPDPSLKPASIRPVEPSPEENRLWYYLDKDHKQIGPVSIIALREEWKRGLIGLETFLWTSGMPQWQKLQDLPGLRETLK